MTKTFIAVWGQYAWKLTEEQPFGWIFRRTDVPAYGFDGHHRMAREAVMSVIRHGATVVCSTRENTVVTRDNIKSFFTSPIPSNCPLCNGDRDWFEVDKVAHCMFCDTLLRV